jgi:hypothetical protein
VQEAIGISAVTAGWGTGHWMSNMDDLKRRLFNFLGKQHICVQFLSPQGLGLDNQFLSIKY